MTAPIQSGDMAEIIEGAMGNQGPNVGKIVRVVAFRGEHSKHGRIWRVSGDNLITEYGAVGDTLDCAQSWLRKIEPPTNTQSHQTTNKETA